MAGQLGHIPPNRAAAFKGRKRGGARRSPYDRLRGRPPRRPLDIVSPLACALLRTPAHVLDANVSRPAARWPPYIAADRRSAPIGDAPGRRGRPPVLRPLDVLCNMGARRTPARGQPAAMWRSWRPPYGRAGGRTVLRRAGSLASAGPRICACIVRLVGCARTLFHSRPRSCRREVKHQSGPWDPSGGIRALDLCDRRHHLLDHTVDVIVPFKRHHPVEPIEQLLRFCVQLAQYARAPQPIINTPRHGAPLVKRSYGCFLPACIVKRLGNQRDLDFKSDRAPVDFLTSCSPIL